MERTLVMKKGIHPDYREVVLSRYIGQPLVLDPLDRKDGKDDRLGGRKRIPAR